MRKLWLIFIAIFVFSFAILGGVGTEIFRQAPPIPREVVTTEGQVLIAAAEEISNRQNVWPDSKRVAAHSNALLKHFGMMSKM